MKVTMLLADSAQVADGKLYILGGGWTVMGPLPTPAAVALLLSVDAHEVNKTHHWELFLEDADGHQVTFETPEGRQPIEVRGDFTVTDVEGAPVGTPIDAPLAVNFGPIPLTPGQRYAWRLVVDGDTPAGGMVSFSTRLAPSNE